MMTTQKQIRESFWSGFPEFREFYRKSWRQNRYHAEIRTTFVDYVDSLARDGQISETLADRVTL